jgi:branched-chain amino acid transport system permease protein
MTAPARDNGDIVDAARKTGSPLIPAVKEALAAAFVALLLSIPILSHRTTDAPSGLVLESRWWLVAAAVAAVFAGRLALSLVGGDRLGALTARAVPQFARLTRLGEIGDVLTRGRWLGWIALAVVVALPLMPFANRYIMDLAVLVLAYVMLGWGLNIVVGLAGLLDLGYVAFYAVGAYAYALLAQHLGLSFWLCLPLAAILAAFFGILLGFPVLRLRGDYLAIVTLAFGEIVRIILINWTSLTGGPNGLSGIPRPTFLGLEFKAAGGPGTVSGTFGIEHSALHRVIWLYYIILLLALLTHAISVRLRRLPIGRAWEALREDEIAARSLGINTTNTKLTAFAIGAGFGGLAGAFFATRQAFISPESFVFMESAIILAIVVLGGMGSQAGVALAALVLIGGIELFRGAAEYRMLIFGLAMVAIMLFKPRGFVGQRTPTVFLKERKVIGADLVREGHG